MIPVPYTTVRWIILLIGAALVAVFFFFPLTIGALMGLGFLLAVTAMAWIVPPGIYGWLLSAKCPTCGGPVEWMAANPVGEPYNEQVVVRCRTCDKTQVEWEYRT
jgi:endogenous inhibitor of DNA gyrase (YacG/DUF329 family)